MSRPIASHLMVSVLAALLLFANIASSAAQSVEEETSRVSIEAADGALQWQIENRTFDVVHTWSDAGPRSLLLEETMSATRRSDMEGPADPLVRVVASEILADGALTPRWEFETRAEAGSARYLGAFGDAYVATLYGCCGAIDADRYFGLETGALLVTANGPVALLDIPNSGGLVRIAGVETPWSASGDPLYQERSDAFGTIGYASMAKELQRVLIVVNLDMMAAIDSLMALPTLEWVPADGEPAREFTHWALDGERDAAKISGVSLRVTYTPEAWVEIPLVADRLDLAAATTAPGLSVEALP
ncbi:MAG: hypothetical protein WEC00_03555 [Dongiaceae bacterium]